MMIVINNVRQLKEILNEKRAQGNSIGFVPTMGALHSGHISLVKRCEEHNDVVVVSIFVNPTQFNDKNDLTAYPRTLEADVKLLEDNGCNIVFAPSQQEMYPDNDACTFNFGVLDKVMEGVNRPGHFNGVWQIVSKLFDAVEPHNSYFGEKDFQQLAIIRHMTKESGYNIEVVGCDICRADSGLALSSRNMLLSEQHKDLAASIHQTLRESSLREWDSAQQAQDYVIDKLNGIEGFEVEYFTIADELNLQPIHNWKDCDCKRGFVVVQLAGVRLIDNIRFN